MSRRIDSPDTEADISLREVLTRENTTCFIVNAGAGSGKTTSLVKALAYLRESNEEDLRRRGQQIACITYTEIAANEIHGEINKDPLFHVSTIHSFLWNVIKPFKRDIAAWVNRRIDEKIAGLDEHNAKPRTQAKTRVKNSALIERLRADRVAASSVALFTYGIGSRYGQGILGHDDIIKMVPQLIIEKPLLRKTVAQRYPFIFVDESQDTFPSVVEALKALSTDPGCTIRIGFFGDPMQQIYNTGIGKIEPGSGWEKINKPQNFRCPTAVLSVINNIRRESSDALLQEGGRREGHGDTATLIEGEAHLFVLPIDDHRETHITHVRNWLATNTADPAWLEDDKESDIRILVIEHRLAARRLGFEEIFSSLHDKSTDALKSGIADGTAWPTLPFVNYFTPLAEAVWEDRRFAQIQLIRTNSPLMRTIEKSADPSIVLAALAASARILAEMFLPTKNAAVRDVLRHAIDSGLWALEDKFFEYTSLIFENDAAVAASDGTEETQRETDAMRRFLDAPATELISYQSYLDEHSVYATHQGVKGAEFQRVLVLLEDDAAIGHGFSYDKLLGLKELSETDQRKVEAGIDNAVDHTRRLFYVGCSRAEKALAVVLFASNAPAATVQMKALNIFDSKCIHGLAAVQPSAGSQISC